MPRIKTLKTADAEAFTDFVAAAAVWSGDVVAATEGAMGLLRMAEFDTAWDVTRKLAWLFVATLEQASNRTRDQWLEEVQRCVLERLKRRSLTGVGRSARAAYSWSTTREGPSRSLDRIAGAGAARRGRATRSARGSDD